MEPVLAALKTWQLHPPATHFAIVLLTTAVVADLIAVIASTRLWLRYMATFLMVAGALAAGLSYVTGLAEFDRIGQAVTGPAQEVLRQHKFYGEYVMYTFGVLALWRIAVQAFSFMARARGMYLILAIVAVGFLYWEARSGSELLYTYGIGTQLMAAAMGSAATPEAQMPTSTPTYSPTPAPAVHEAPTATLTPTASATPTAPPTIASSASASPSQSPAASATGAAL